jgi:putative methyltransferase (TIGR04325 family)
MRLSDFVPPILSRLRHWERRAQPAPPLVKLPELFSSYEEAQAACGAGGYEQQDLVEVVFRKTKAYRDALFAHGPVVVNSSAGHSLLAVMTALRESRDKLDVLDFGGACGAHYFAVKAFVRDSVTFRWHIVETPAMAERAREMETSELKFFSSLAETEMGNPDLLHSSGAIQYTPSPPDTLRMLVNCGARILLISRMGLAVGSANVITAQTSLLSSNGPGPLPEGMKDGECKYPVTFVQKQILSTIIESAYQLRLQLEDDSGAFSVGPEQIVGAAYLAEKRK